MQVFLLIAMGALTGLINGFFGGGGGMVIVPVLLYVNKLTVKAAHATALLVILPVSIVSGIFYLGIDSFDAGLLLNVGLGVLAGGAIGALLLKKASNTLITVIFSVLMAAAGVKLLFF